MLVLKMFRNIKQSFGRVLSIVALVLMGVMFYTGMNGLISNLARVGEKYFKDSNLADAWIYGERITWQDVKNLKKLPQVLELQGGITLDITLKQYNEATMRLHSQDDFQINKLLIEEGTSLQKDDPRSIAISKSFADVYGIKVGDDFHFEFLNQRKTLKVRALIKNAEYIYPIKDASMMLPDPTAFCYAYCSTDVMWRDIYPDEKMYNTLTLKLSQGTDAEEFEQRVKDVLRYRLSSFVPYKDHPAGAMFEAEIKNSQAIMGAIPLIFFMVAALVTLTTLARMVETERMEIGIIKALGYSNFSVLVYYSSFAAMVAIFGSALGAVIGLIIPNSMMSLYDEFFDLPAYTIEIDSVNTFYSSLIALGFCLVAAVFACRKAMRITPAQCMRPKAPKPGKRILLERIGFVWRRVNFSFKMIFRNIFRNKMRLIMCIFGVSMCTALIVTALSMRTSMVSMLDTQNEIMFNYDLDVLFEYSATKAQKDHIVKLDGVKATEFQMESGVTFVKNSSKNSAITVLENTSTMVLLEPDVASLSLPDDGALIDKKLADEIGVKPGDYFTAAFSGEKNTLSIMCAAVSDTMLGQGAYVSKNYWRTLGRHYLPMKVHAVLVDGYDKEQFISRVSDYDFVDSVIDRETSMKSFEKTMEMMNVEIVIFVLAAGMLAFVVLYNLGLQNMFERMRELATLKVLGFYPNEIKGVVLLENILFTGIGSLLGLPIGKWMVGYVFAQAQDQIETLKAVTTMDNYIFSVLLTFGFALTVNLILGGRFKSIDMVQSLKSIE